MRSAWVRDPRRYSTAGLKVPEWRPALIAGAEYNQNIAAVRAQLDEATFAAAWAEGPVMTLEQAVAYALDQA